MNLEHTYYQIIKDLNHHYLGNDNTNNNTNNNENNDENKDTNNNTNTNKDNTNNTDLIKKYNLIQNQDDPFIQFLSYHYGIVRNKNRQEAFNLLNKIHK